MTRPDLNTRPIRRDDDGYFIATADTALCGFCGLVATCKAKQALSRLTKKHPIKPVIRRCEQFQPILSFQSDKGTELSFNTFRIGGAWAARARPGDVMSLWLSKTGERIGAARVTKVVSGPLKVVMSHAPMNHMFLGGEPEHAMADMPRVLRNAYGSSWVNADKTFTVIYMERVDEAGRGDKAQAAA